jgi:hypothetical protein
MEQKAVNDSSNAEMADEQDLDNEVEHSPQDFTSSKGSLSVGASDDLSYS